MLHHIEKFHLDELSDEGFKNLCKYCIKRGLLAISMLPSFEDKNFRQTATVTCQGRLLLSLSHLLEFVDMRVPYGAYDLKRNASRNAWKFDHEEATLNTSEPPELISVLWNISKPFFEKGTKIE